MAWDFETDAEYQVQLDWAGAFVRDQVEPLDLAFRGQVHKVTVARQVLRGYSPSDDRWPSEHIPRRLAAAREKYAEYLEHEVGNL